MDAPPPVSADDLAATPPSVLALIQWQARQIARLTARVAELEAQVADLTARLNKDSTNSSVPPSSTHPHAKPLSPKPQSKRRRGGQPGHDKHERALIPVEDCQAVVPCVPTACRRCGIRSGNSPTSSRS
jgi:transposase